MFEHLPRLVGQALRNARAGMQSIVYFDDALADVPETIEVGSSAFADGQALPPEFTADGAGVSPPLRWSGVPTEAVSLILVIEDPDAPSPRPLVHGIAWNLPAEDSAVEADALAKRAPTKRTFALGRNSFLGAEYLAPDPPKGHGLHRYGFQVFAVSRNFRFHGCPGRTAIVGAVREHTLARGLLVGTYERQ